MKFLQVLSLLIIAHGLSAQSVKITGLLTGPDGKAITQASVLLKNAESVIAFAISTETGTYTIKVQDSAGLSKLHLEIHSLGFRDKIVTLENGKLSYDMKLETDPQVLKELIVKNRPVIESKGDTLSYDVASFSRPEDRSIGEVMSHMPGITVDENGQISFNGKAISNLYIHGDDLMDGRYGLATRAITKDIIKSVDVMKNFQPVKVLKDRVLTDNVAINLVLKDENSLKLSGQAMLGGGLPQQYDLSVNPMLLNKRIKMLNSVKANNSGQDYLGDFMKYGSSDYLANLGNTRPAALISAGTAGNPDLPKRNYNLNRTGLINANNLYNLKTGLQVRSNIQLYADRNRFNYLSRVEQYLEADTIRYLEEQMARRGPSSLTASFSANLNKPTFYFSNTFRVNVSAESNSSWIRRNNDIFNQRLEQRIRDLSNDLAWTPLLKNRNIIDLHWYLDYYNAPQQLGIDTGLHAAILNNGNPFRAIQQFAETPTFFSHASASYRLTKGKIRQNYLAGVLNERQNLSSKLLLDQFNGAANFYTGDPGNALQWRRDRIYANASYDTKGTNWQASLSIPLIVQSIQYKQFEYSLNSTHNQVFTNPDFSVKFFLNAEDNIAASYSYTNNVGNISGVFRGLILSNYRSFRVSDAALQENISSGPSINYQFQRSIIMLFINAGLSYSKVKANSILSSQLTNNVQRTILLPFENDQSRLSATASISKYLFNLKTTAALKTLFTRSRAEQFINNNFFPFLNDSYSLTGSIDKKLRGGLTVNYSGNYNWNISRPGTGGKEVFVTRMKRFDQTIALAYNPLKGLFLNIRGRQIYSRLPGISPINYIFTDAGARYKLAKIKTDLELEMTNLSNIRKYELLLLSSNQFSYSNYQIRGRMAIIKATFNF